MRRACCTGIAAGLPPRTAAAPGRPAAGIGPALRYRYVGATRLTVWGRVSGRPYHFAQPGAELVVDPHDLPSMRGIPGLERVA